MSYCRWSSMDHTCDLYVYESDRGLEVIVARNRRVLTEPLPVLSALELTEIDHGAAARGEEPHVSKRDDWLDRNRRRHEILEAAEIVPIDLPYAGEHEVFDDLAAAADWIAELGALGYVFPDTLVADLREEAASTD